MRTIWNILSVLAVANLLGLAGFLGWLGATDRLSVERLRHVRETFSPTLAQDRAKAEAEAKSAEEAKKVEAVAARKAGTPEAAAETVERQRAEDDARAQAARRTARELDDLRRRLIADRDALDSDRAKLAAEREAFEKLRKAERERVESEQFRQALATLEAQRPRDAQAVLSTMLGSAQEEQAVRYLASMNDRARGRIMAEFVKTDGGLAARLLEGLRKHGVPAEPAAPAPSVGGGDGASGQASKGTPAGGGAPGTGSPAGNRGP